jgi:nucleotide-binding universal stress UspA family protein
MLSHVLVPIDGSNLSEKALDYALNILDKENGRLTLMTVIDPPATRFQYPTLHHTAPESTIEVIREMEQATEHSRSEAREYVQHWAERLASTGLQIETLVRQGDPAKEILAYEEEHVPDAIVMATHGRSGISRWLLGSVTQKVLNAACVPVFVIPSRACDDDNAIEKKKAANQTDRGK